MPHIADFLHGPSRRPSKGWGYPHWSESALRAALRSTCLCEVAHSPLLCSPAYLPSSGLLRSSRWHGWGCDAKQKIFKVQLVGFASSKVYKKCKSAFWRKRKRSLLKQLPSKCSDKRTKGREWRAACTGEAEKCVSPLWQAGLALQAAWVAPAQPQKAPWYGCDPKVSTPTGIHLVTPMLQSRGTRLSLMGT